MIMLVSLCNSHLASAVCSWLGFQIANETFLGRGIQERCTHFPEERPRSGCVWKLDSGVSASPRFT